MPERANPDTCHHHLAYVVADMRLNVFVVCCSCDATLDDSFKNEFNWTFDWKYNNFKRRTLKREFLPDVWIHYCEGSERTESLPRGRMWCNRCGATEDGAAG